MPQTIEADRLAALDSYDVLDTATETVFEDLARLATRMVGTPSALLSLIDARRQWFKARIGLDLVETPRDQAFCVYALDDPFRMMLVPDTRLDARFEDNPLVTGPPGIRFYAGAPLVTPDGHVLGALCVMDRVPRTLSTEQQDALSALARTVMTTLELRRSRRRAEELALTDPLTGLSNRRAFLDVLGRAIAKQNRDGEVFGLLYLDLDGFKQVNDFRGHDTGDKLLRDVAQALLAAVRREDVVARLGGDEFAVLLAGDTIATVAETVRKAVGRQMEACEWEVTASVGAVTFVSPPANEVAATIAADRMMYAAKGAGKNCTRHAEVGRRATAPIPYAGPDAGPDAGCEGMEAAEQGEPVSSVRFDPARLDTHFQPIVDLRTGVVLGVEALARLRDGDALLPPSVFLPGLSAPDLRRLLFAVLDQGLALLARCGDTHPALTLSVNVDPVLLLEPGFTAALLARLARSAIDNGRITLELLETGRILDRAQAWAQLQGLRDTRVRIALDDVGSGYSSLTRLRNLPIDGVKLDQAFVRGMGQRPSDLLFVTNMMSLAIGLGRSFTVEGVETPEILDALAVLGVGPAQGYAIARPMEGDALVAWLAAHVPSSARRQPESLLGVYAAHLNIVRATEALMHQPLDVTWLEQAYDPHACLIGRFFDQNGLHDTAYGLAHKRFHSVLSLYQTDKLRWEEAAQTFRMELEIAIHRGAAGRTGSTADAGPRPQASTALQPIPQPVPGDAHGQCCGDHHR